MMTATFASFQNRPFKRLSFWLHYNYNKKGAFSQLQKGSKMLKLSFSHSTFPESFYIFPVFPLQKNSGIITLPTMQPWGSSRVNQPVTHNLFHGFQYLQNADTCLFLSRFLLFGIIKKPFKFQGFLFLIYPSQFSDFWAKDGTRTRCLLLPKQTLYPVELLGTSAFTRLIILYSNPYTREAKYGIFALQAVCFHYAP